MRWRSGWKNSRKRIWHLSVLPGSLSRSGYVLLILTIFCQSPASKRNCFMRTLIGWRWSSTNLNFLFILNWKSLRWNSIVAWLSIRSCISIPNQCRFTWSSLHLCPAKRLIVNRYRRRLPLYNGLRPDMKVMKRFPFCSKRLLRGRWRNRRNFSRTEIYIRCWLPLRDIVSVQVFPKRIRYGGRALIITCRKMIFWFGRRWRMSIVPDVGLPIKAVCFPNRYLLCRWMNLWNAAMSFVSTSWLHRWNVGSGIPLISIFIRWTNGRWQALRWMRSTRGLNFGTRMWCVIWIPIMFLCINQLKNFFMTFPIGMGRIILEIWQNGCLATILIGRICFAVGFSAWWRIGVEWWGRIMRIALHRYWLVRRHTGNLRSVAWFCHRVCKLITRIALISAGSGMRNCTWIVSCWLIWMNSTRSALLNSLS